MEKTAKWLPHANKEKKKKKPTQPKKLKRLETAWSDFSCAARTA